MKDETYNGWTNWDTWNVFVWITNDESDYRVACACSKPEILKAFMIDLCAKDGADPDKVNWQEIFDHLAEDRNDEQT